MGAWSGKDAHTLIRTLQIHRGLFVVFRIKYSHDVFRSGCWDDVLRCFCCEGFCWLKTKDRKEEIEQKPRFSGNLIPFKSLSGNCCGWVDTESLRKSFKRGYLDRCCSSRYCKQRQILLVPPLQTGCSLTAESWLTTGKALTSPTLGPPPSQAAHQSGAPEAGCWVVTLRGKGATKQRRGGRGESGGRERERGKKNKNKKGEQSWT